MFLVGPKCELKSSNPRITWRKLVGPEISFLAICLTPVDEVLFLAVGCGLEIVWSDITELFNVETTFEPDIGGRPAGIVKSLVK